MTMPDPATNDPFANGANPFLAMAAAAQSQAAAQPSDDPFANGNNPFLAMKTAGESGGNGKSYEGTTAAKALGMLGAGLSEGAIGVLGAPGNLITGAGNLVSRGINAVTGSNIPMEESPIGTAAIKRGFGAIDPRMNPDNLVPQNELESAIRGTGAGIGAAVVPIGMVGALGDKAAAAAEPFVGANTTAA